MHASTPQDKLLVRRQIFDVLLGSKLTVLEVFLPIDEFFISKLISKMKDFKIILTSSSGIAFDSCSGNDFPLQSQVLGSVSAGLQQV